MTIRSTDVIRSDGSADLGFHFLVTQVDGGDSYAGKGMKEPDAGHAREPTDRTIADRVHLGPHLASRR